MELEYVITQDRRNTLSNIFISLQMYPLLFYLFSTYKSITNIVLNTLRPIRFVRGLQLLK